MTNIQEVTQKTGEHLCQLLNNMADRIVELTAENVRLTEELAKIQNGTK
jgi:hypothetical protein